MQESFVEIATILSIISLTITTIGLIVKHLIDRRVRERNLALEATVKGLLPYYGLVIKAISKTNLLLNCEGSVSYSDVGIDLDEFYEQLGSAFVYIKGNKTRNLIVQFNGFLEAFHHYTRINEDFKSLRPLLKEMFEILTILKQHVELYIMLYSTSLVLPKGDDKISEHLDDFGQEKLGKAYWATIESIVNRGE